MWSYAPPQWGGSHCCVFFNTMLLALLVNVAASFI